MVEPVRIEIEDGAMTITWDDGRRDDLPGSLLRRSCPCAGCREPGGMNAHESARVLDARLVGGYAVGLRFGPDDHATGIFSFSLLRTLGES